MNKETAVTSRSVTHNTFVLTREYPATPARVFAAFADPAAKAKWFGAPTEAGQPELELDFRVGGREINRGGPPQGPIYTFEAVYQDIVADERIVTTYFMLMGDQRISVSLATVELQASDGGTRLVYTEQGAYLDGYDTPDAREHGTRELLDALGVALSA
jgi:uncharacterized protein YndB with AHSA1/START domain